MSKIKKKDTLGIIRNVNENKTKGNSYLLHFERQIIIGGAGAGFFIFFRERERAHSL